MKSADLEQLLPSPPPDDQNRLQASWCTVTAVDPVRVRLDGDSEPIPYTPTNLAGLLQIGQRVWCLRAGYTLVLVGTYGPDEIAPNPPSAPVGAQSLDGLTFTWDGLDADGAEQPVDWRYAELHLSPVADYEPSAATLAGVYPSADGGRLAVYGLSPAVTYYARLVSVDFTGNRSGRGAVSVGISPRPLVEDASIADAIAEVQATADGKARVVRSVLDPGPGDVAGFTRGDQWWVYNDTLLTGFYLFSGTAWVPQQLANAVLATVDAGKVTTGILNAERLVGIDITGVTITGSLFRTATSGRRSEYDSSGFRKYSASGDLVFLIDTTTDDVGVYFGVSGVPGNYYSSMGATGFGVTYYHTAGSFIRKATVAFDTTAQELLLYGPTGVRIDTDAGALAVNDTPILLGGESIGAQMTKTSTGPAYSTNTWTRVTGFVSPADRANGITANPAAGTFTAVDAGWYRAKFHARWQYYGSAYRRQAAIVKGTSAPAANNSNVITQAVFGAADWLCHDLEKRRFWLDTGDVVSFWVYSTTDSTFNNTTSAPVPDPTYVEIEKVL